MKVKYEIMNNTLYFYLIGELDECAATKTRSSIDKIIDEYKRVDAVVFNLQSLSFMDSTGIGMLIGRYKKIKGKGMGLFIEKPSLNADKVLEISGLYKIMPKI